MRYETSSPLRYPTARGGVCVVEGYGVRLYVRNATGTEVARTMRRDKLAGQAAVLDRLAHAADVRAASDTARAGLETAPTVNEMVMAERDAALAYWTAWAPVAIRFRPSDLPR